MFGKDYWKMSNEQLEKIGRELNIATYTAREDPEENPGAEFFFHRTRVIDEIVARDTAMRAGWAFKISLLALLLSTGALACTIIINFQAIKSFLSRS